MGWEKGKGLGKELRGRAIPVEATVRKGKGAIGAYGPESKEAKFKNQREEEQEEEPVHVSQWKKDVSSVFNFVKFKIENVGYMISIKNFNNSFCFEVCFKVFL